MLIPLSTDDLFAIHSKATIVNNTRAYRFMFLSEINTLKSTKDIIQ